MRFTYCPVCGKRLALRDRGDEGPVPYCGTCGRSWHDSFTAAIIAAVVNEDGEVALLRQGYIAESTWVCVSGIMRPGESAEETAAREIQEELGLPVRELTYMGSWPYPRKDMLMLGFMALADRAPLRLSGEVDAARWVPFAEAPALIREGSVAWQLVNASIALQANTGAAPLCGDIRYLTERALWETENLIRCVPDELWDKRYDELPMWKYIYHTLYSMDRWYINPADPDYRDPPFHREGLADLNAVPGTERVDRAQMEAYFQAIAEKLRRYAAGLRDVVLTECPPGCDMSRFRLILGQFRHWHRHMGLVYGFLVEDTGRWPYVLNMLGAYPEDPMPNFYP